MTRFIPIANGRRLRLHAYERVLGCMFYPEDEPSAMHLARMLAAEPGWNHRKNLSAFMSGVFGKLPVERLCLAGEMALFVAQFILDTGKPNLSKAAFVASEEHSTDTTLDGSPLATAEVRIRKAFRSHLSVVHFLGALQLQNRLDDEIALPQLLGYARMILDIHEQADLGRKTPPWRVPDVEGVPTAVWPEEGLYENPDSFQAILADYKSRSGL